MFLITFFLWTTLCKTTELVIVRVEQGLLRGELRNRSTGNGQFCSFKGIPYAAPPIGELRFKASQPALKWDGVRNATEHGPICPQMNIDNAGDITGNEDCLFLNVYTPTMHPNACLPVMFYIHGGGLATGSGNDDKYGPDFLLDHNVVVVTINYRLGALGFLSLDTKEAPGNAGLKDQVQALRWVKTNIIKFGGDPNEITIFGQSAGGSSVSLHVLSPMSKGLFKKAIVMSGVCVSEFVVDFEHRRQALILAHKIGLYTENPQEAFKFLQNASVKDIVTTAPIVSALDKLKNDILKRRFPPVVEKKFGAQYFMTEQPEKLLLEGKTNTKDIVIGHTLREGITRAVLQKEYIFRVYPYFKELLVPTNITTQLAPKKVLQLADCIQKHYFGDKEISETNMKSFIKFYSYIIYAVDIHRYLEMWIKGGNRAYLYEFSCFSERNVNGLTAVKYGVKAAGHFDDLMYLFYGNIYSLPLNKSSPSYKMIIQICSLFTNYAKYGNLTPDVSLGTKWDYYNKNLSMLNIDLNLTSQRTPLKEIDFWRQLYQSVGAMFS